MNAEPPADAMYLLLVTGDAMFKDNRISAGVLAHVKDAMGQVPDGGLLIYDDGIGGPAWCASKMAEWGDVYRICYKADGRRWGFTGRIPFGQDSWWPHLSFPDPCSMAIEMVRRVCRARHDGWTVRGLIYHAWSPVGLADATREAWDHLLPPAWCLSSDVSTTGEILPRTHPQSGVTA